LKIQNGQILAMHNLIYFVFRSMMGFSGTVDWSALFLVRSNRRQLPAAILKNSNGQISTMHYLIHFMYVRRPYPIMTVATYDWTLISQRRVTSQHMI